MIIKFTNTNIGGGSIRLAHIQHTRTRDQSFGIQRKQGAGIGSVYLVLEYLLKLNDSFKVHIFCGLLKIYEL